MIVRLKGGYVCAVKSWTGTGGDAYTLCGNKHKNVNSVALGAPKCAKCFAQIVAQRLLELPSHQQQELADEFQVTVSTVSRWASGVARPHPRIQKQILDSIARRRTAK